jgi:hypothetical protein
MNANHASICIRDVPRSRLCNEMYIPRILRGTPYFSGENADAGVAGNVHTVNMVNLVNIEREFEEHGPRISTPCSGLIFQ